MATATRLIIPLIAGYFLDLLLGDPVGWPHPVRLFGALIAKGEAMLNKGRFRFFKGGVLSITLCAAVFISLYYLLSFLWAISQPLYLVVSSVLVFYALANRQLILEGTRVFETLSNNGLEAGRHRLSHIVGRDTSRLGPGQIRTAVLETLSENLSDGVIAPLFYYALAGLPGMYVYKMINTLDSMIGYRNERYEQFGKFAARLDDVANFLPARITALLMVAVTASGRGMRFIIRYGHRHKSPNAGYPEAALAGILDVRFGGPNFYHGVLVEKPFIGDNIREVMPGEIKRVADINQRTCLLMILLILIIFLNYG